MTAQIFLHQSQELAAPGGPAGGTYGVPALVGDAGEDAVHRFVEFFTAHIRNANTRAAYFRCLVQFDRWVRSHGLGLLDLRPPHVAAYIEELSTTRARPTVKQHLAAIRMLFDWLVVGQVMPSNPAHAVRGPKYKVTLGKTPVLGEDEARQLIDAIRVSDPVTRAWLPTLLPAKRWRGCGGWTFLRARKETGRSGPGRRNMVI